MKLFEWKVAIILIIIIAICTNLIAGYANSNYGLGTGMILTAFFPLIIVFYFIAWVLMWNAGKANSPFKIIKLLSK